jgi:hypothetical protein
VARQCKWRDMESTRSAGGGSRSSTGGGGAVEGSAGGGAAWSRAHCTTQKPNLRLRYRLRTTPHGNTYKQIDPLSVSIFCQLFNKPTPPPARPSDLELGDWKLGTLGINLLSVKTGDAPRSFGTIWGSHELQGRRESQQGAGVGSGPPGARDDRAFLFNRLNRASEAGDPALSTRHCRSRRIASKRGRQNKKSGTPVGG